MTLTITRTDIIEVEPVPGTPLAEASAAAQLAAFRAAFTKTIFDDHSGLALETSDGEWAYQYVDHVSVQVGFVPADPPPRNGEEP
jgi:hypothetical protein